MDYDDTADIDFGPMIRVMVETEIKNMAKLSKLGIRIATLEESVVAEPIVSNSLRIDDFCHYREKIKDDGGR